MAMNFGTYIGPGNNTGIPFNFGNTNTTPIPQPSGIQVIPASNRQVADDYPLSAGTTGFFFNYNGRRIYIKTQNQNGLSYDMEELIILRPEEFQQLQQQALNNQNQRPEQQTNFGGNGASYVTKGEFEEFVHNHNNLATAFQELKEKFEEFIK
jgi:hypothetical protein